MTGEIRSGPEEFIRELMRREHGLRKCARILFFIDRRQLIELLLELPDETIVALAREMAKIRATIPDLAAERRRLGESLGRLTEVIDLGKSIDEGNRLFAFLDGSEPEGLAVVADGLDEESLAVLLVNAPPESAAMLLGTVDRQRVRRDLIEEMTRLGARGRGRGRGRAESVAQQARAAMAEHERSTRPPKPSTSSERPRPSTEVESIVARADRTELERLVAGVPSDHLALALHSGDRALEDLLRRHSGPRRWADVQGELAGLEAVDPVLARAARRAVLRRLVHGLEEKIEEGEGDSS